MTPRPRKSDRPSAFGRLSDGSANPIDVHVGRRMRLRRRLLGMSQEALGGAIGLTFQQVLKYERGANRIGASRLFDLSRVLDVPVSYFFDDMSADVQAQSPAAVATGMVTEVGAVTGAPDPLTSRETLELIRHYYAIEPKARAQVYQLARALARVEEDA